MPETQQAGTDEKPADAASTPPDAEADADADKPAAETHRDEENEGAAAPPRVRHHRKLLAGAAGLAAAALAGTVLTFALPEEKPAPPPYTVAVTYKVTGEGKATLTYNTGDPDRPGGREQLVELPWAKKVRVDPETGAARVSIILDKDGGKAQCAVSVAGQHRQRATAFGNFGRATCTARVPERGAAKR